MPFTTIWISGYLDDLVAGPRWVDPAMFESPRIHVEDVLAAIDAAAAAGTKALLLVVDGPGGLVSPTVRLCERVRRFAAEGGMTIAWVKWAGSGHVELALACEVVVMDCGGHFYPHSVKLHRSVSLVADHVLKRSINSQRARFMAERSLIPPEAAEAMLVAEGGSPHDVHQMDTDTAVALGFADLPGGLEVARSFAERGLPPGFEKGARQVALAERRRELRRATAALAQLTDIASDGILTAGEKPPVILQNTTITGEQSSIDAQATNYGITTEKTTYDNAVSALATYLATLTTPVLWSNLTGNTTIVGTTFRTKFADVYSARQALLDKIAALSATPAKTSAISDRDNVWPGPSSEIAPPTGADTTQPEWADRVNAGAGAYSGSWVREKTGAGNGFYVPCSPGASFYAEAQSKRTAGTGLGGRLGISFVPTYGSLSGATTTSGAYSTSGSWAKISVTSGVAPAGTNAAFIAYEAASGDTIWFDALYARRIVSSDIIATEIVTPTTGTGWSATTAVVRKTGGQVFAQLKYTVPAGGTVAGASWGSVFTLPTGARPQSEIVVYGSVHDASSGIDYQAEITISAGGVCIVGLYDNGTQLAAPFAIGDGDWVKFSVVFSWV